MRKKFMSLVLTLALAAGVMACGSKEEPATPAPAETGAQENEGEEAASGSPEGITLRWVGAGWSQNDKATNIIAKWNAIHPDIAVDYIELGIAVDEGYLTNLDTMISGGEVVDLTYLTYDDVYKRVIIGGLFRWIPILRRLATIMRICTAPCPRPCSPTTMRFTAFPLREIPSRYFTTRP
jgi:ABC-type glycerol-3-phosphate transport system substrate-binding protein